MGFLQRRAQRYVASREAQVWAAVADRCESADRVDWLHALAGVQSVPFIPPSLTPAVLLLSRSHLYLDWLDGRIGEVPLPAVRSVNVRDDRWSLTLDVQLEHDDLLKMHVDLDVPGQGPSSGPLKAGFCEHLQALVAAWQAALAERKVRDEGDQGVLDFG